MSSGMICIVLLALCVVRIECYPTGAPLEQCIGMQPNVYEHGNEQTGPSMYTLTIPSNETVAGERVIMVIRGDSLKGLLLQAREKESGHIIGTWSELKLDNNEARFKTLDCDGPDSAITHHDGETKHPEFYFNWFAPVNASGDVEFVATIVKTKTEYWRNIKSETLYVKPLGNCTRRDYHLYEQCSQYSAFIRELNNDIYNPEGICSKLEPARASAFECVEHYHQLCEDAGEEADQNIATTVNNVYMIVENNTANLLAIYCDDCGFVEVNRCFYPLTLLNLTDVQGSCSAYQTANDCLTDLEATCTANERPLLLSSDRRHTEAANASLQANLQMCEQYQSCPTVNERKQTLEICIKEDVTVTFNNVCALAQSYRDCLSLAFDDCQLLEDTMTTHLTMVRTLLAAFGCTPENFTPLDSDCNLRQLVECYNPVLEHLSMSPITNNSSLDFLLSLLNVMSASGYVEVKRNDVCSDIEPLLQSATSCFITEATKCPFNPSLEELDVSIPVKERPSHAAMEKGLDPAFLEGLTEETDSLLPAVSLTCEIQSLVLIWTNGTNSWLLHLSVVIYSLALQPLVTVDADFNFEIFTVFTEPLKRIAMGLNELNDHLKLLCDEGCEDADEKRLNFLGCIQGDGDFKTAVGNVLEKYQNGEPRTEEDCHPISQYVRCAAEHLTGCGLSESTVVPDNEVTLYQAIDICGVQGHINYREPTVCLDETYNNHLLKTIPKACPDITREEISRMSSEELCGLIEERSSCYLQMTPCCGLKKLLLEPRFFTWSVMYGWLMCDSVLNETNFVTARPNECNVNAVIKCYNLIFITHYIPAPDNKHLLSRLSSVRDDFLTASRRNTYCTTESGFQAIEDCVAEKTMSCSFPPACQNQNIAVASGPVPLAFADVVGLKKNKELCSQDCQNKNLTTDSVNECDAENIPKYVQMIVWNDVKGLTSPNQCSSLQAAVDCFKSKIGTCDPMRKYINDHLDREPLRQAAALCDLDVVFLEPEPLQWEVQEYTTTTPAPTTPVIPSVISTASPEVRLTVWLYAVALAQLFWW